MPSPIDVTAPFDPTAYTTLSGAQLLQLVSGLAPYADKGLIVTTTDSDSSPQAPDAVGTAKWKTYIWKRIGYDNNIYLYVWNPNKASDETYLQWQSINLTGIPSNTVLNSMLAGGITQDKIVSLLWSQISPGSIPSATGPLTGVYPNVSLLAQRVYGGGVLGHIVENTIAKTELAPQSIDPTDASFKYGTAHKLLSTNAAGNGAEWEVLGIFSGQNGIAIAQGQTYSVAHNLGAVPSFVRAVIVCTSNDGATGHIAGDEVDFNCLFGQVGATYHYHGGVCWANSANVVATITSGVTNLQIIKAGTDLGTNITLADWAIKIYARL